MAFSSLEEIMEYMEKHHVHFWEAVLEDDLAQRDVTREASMEQMRYTWDAMLQASADYEPERKSASALAGGQGKQMETYCTSRTPLCGEFMGRVMTEALKTAESNACMKRIVAAPTAGASGVLPAVLIPYYETHASQDETVLEAMYTAAGIGQVIALRASISGAQGGCQAEIGSASAMAAGALVSLEGGSGKQIIHAAAMALKNLMGLVCDPVAGLVEIPCIKRNVIGAVNALSSADMALAGIESRIPPDQVIDAMKAVGDKMDTSLRETGMGGLAATPVGIEIMKQLKNHPSFGNS
ncbi:MAG: L-serine ammonia-lyase, iron-sulfur-dependent, subunit alpha [Lachnospiraceae bacterium]|nr:L-serine ammonia-lyase, iron-sulfur-dependent, subunit alpha [Lachnospiraceae bacterium]